jgi:hypothetical protein
LDEIPILITMMQEMTFMRERMWLYLLKISNIVAILGRSTTNASDGREWIETIEAD